MPTPPAALASAGATSPTPPFRPTILTHPDPNSASASTPSSGDWIPLLSSPAHFPLPIFLSTLKDLCLHPERNSSLILRADSLPPRPIPDSDVPDGFTPVEEVRVRLMPRQPKRDGKLLQRCLFFRAEEDPAEGKKEEGQVLYLPEVKERGEVPFYYPPVRGLRYRWVAEPPALDEEEGEADQKETKEEEVEGQEQGEVRSEETKPPPILGTISISYLPWPDAAPPTSTPPLLSAPPNSLSPARSLPHRRSPLSAPPIGADGETEHEPGAAEADDTEPVAPAAVVLDASPPPSAVVSDVKKSTERITRIAAVLLETVYKHGFGRMVGYKKRVHHDVIVQREPFQDLYLVLKERHRHLDSRAPKPGSTSTKVEDVKRHVFKDFDVGLPDDPLLPTTSHSHLRTIDTQLSPVDLSEWGQQDVAIAAFLMLLWKDMYPSREAPLSLKERVEEDWDTWGRPPAGFVDLGCGNGLLVHILTSEGYRGKGYELRKRRTWPAYPPETQQNLIELPIDFPSWFPSTMAEWEAGDWEGRAECPIGDGVFMVGNHADEITPWIPLLSLLPPTPVPFLSLPCCAHTLDSAFTPSVFNPPPHPHSPSTGFDAGLEAGQSRYKAYLMFLGSVGLKCGWEWEKEGLRVPSTRGWGIVGRNRWAKTPEELRECREYALGEVNQVRARGAFKVRVKEGKEH